MSHIHMHSGRLVDIFNVTGADIDIETIAHHLSQICRFVGATKEFFSVAEHCVHLSHKVRPEYAAHALLHDASEAFVGDVAWPAKRMGYFEPYRENEDKLMKQIFAHFGIAPGEPEEVYRLDKEAAFHEGSALVPGWEPKIYPATLYQCWSPKEAKAKYLERFAELIG